ncbi:permease-like cell division protein FtsX [Actinoplanes sp. GCM10030250]|uniref:permease-like cell division protein FtsX n=1 Tax=Actinoplanes sp. GCM10030250 TaxID=3273376 RepID=UPI00361A89CD
MTHGDPDGDAPPPSEPSRRLRMMLAVTAAALVIGAAASTSVLLLAGYRYVPDRKFEVAVFLEPDISAEDKAVIRAELDEFPDGGAVRLETRDEALARVKETWKHQPDRVEGIQLESMSESFRLISVAREFDCGPVPEIRELAGVERVWIAMRPAGGRYGAELSC